MTRTGVEVESCSSNFQKLSLHSCQEGNGESDFAASQIIMRETDIHGIIVNSQIINVFREKIGTRHAELNRAKKKSRGFSANRLADKGRDLRCCDFSSKLHNYVIGKENQDLRGDRVEEDGIQRGSNR